MIGNVMENSSRDIQAKVAKPPWWGGGPAIVAYLATIKMVLHLATAKFYGPFIDELYFLACGQYLSEGYDVMPPLTAFEAWFTRTVFCDSMHSISHFSSLTSRSCPEAGGKASTNTSNELKRLDTWNIPRP